MSADRHVVMGAGGTAITTSSVAVLVAAPPDSEIVRRCESIVADPIGAAEFVERLHADHLAVPVAIAAAIDAVVEVAVAGTAEASIDGVAVVRHDSTGSERCAVAEATGDSRLVLSLPDQDEPTGQWLTTGVIAAGAVAVGRLRARARVMSSGSADSDQIDFGSLISTASGSGGDRVDGSERPPEAEPAQGASADRSDPTAAFVVGGSAEEVPSGVLVFSSGEEVLLDAPIVVGRRPPADEIGGSTPARVTIDDRMLSRHHATFRSIDGHLVVTDEGSTNGTFLSGPDLERTRCPANRPTQVPAGAAVDLAGVVTVTHRQDTMHEGSTSC